jgi:hypothetical protein
MTTPPELLDTKVLVVQGSWRRVQRWYRGVHPTLGKIHHGLTGLETIEEIDIFIPNHLFVIKDTTCG